MASHTARIEVHIADLEPVKRLIAGAETMAANETAGGDGWWDGWEEVRAALAELRGEGTTGGGTDG